MEVTVLRGGEGFAGGDVDASYQAAFEEGWEGGLEDVDSASGAELPFVVGDGVGWFFVTFGRGEVGVGGEVVFWRPGDGGGGGELGVRERC